MINNRYRLKLTPQAISIQPHYYLLKKNFRWYINLLVAAALCLPLAEQYFGETGLVIDLGMAGTILFYMAKDYFFSINIRYIFDRSTRCIYKSNPPFAANKPIIRFNETTIFTCAECGYWYYAIGIKQKQFLKNYCISEPFGSGKKSTQQQEYEQQILSKINDMIAS